MNLLTIKIRKSEFLSLHQLFISQDDDGQEKEAEVITSPQFSLPPECEEKTPIEHQMLGNRIDIGNLKVTGYSLRQKGGQYILQAIVATNEQITTGCEVIHQLVAELTNEKNRWEAIAYTHLTGDIHIAARERRNARKTDGSIEPAMTLTF